VQQAVSEQRFDVAAQAYNQTLALPQTDTESQLTIEGIQMNGAWHAGNEDITICYKGTVAHLLKALTPKEAKRGSAFLLANPRNEYLTSFEICQYNSKTFMIMPYYTSTLESLSKLTIPDGLKLFDQMLSAINCIQELDFNHMVWFHS
jgi:hypothetical protein